MEKVIEGAENTLAQHNKGKKPEETSLEDKALGYFLSVMRCHIATQFFTNMCNLGCVQGLWVHLFSLRQRIRKKSLCRQSPDKY